MSHSIDDLKALRSREFFASALLELLDYFVPAVKIRCRHDWLGEHFAGFQYDSQGFCVGMMVNLTNKFHNFAIAKSSVGKILRRQTTVGQGHSEAVRHAKSSFFSALGREPEQRKGFQMTLDPRYVAGGQGIRVE